jgi:hypothetical protein
VIEAARRLRGEAGVAFCFVGGGSEFKRVQAIARDERLGNVVFLPYKPLSGLAASLSAADLHVVVMGEPFVGTTHPCKIYNILAVAAPVLYIGRDPSHLTDILASLRGGWPAFHLRHGDAAGVVGVIERLRGKGDSRPQVPPEVLGQFSRDRLLPVLVKELAG